MFRDLKEVRPGNEYNLGCLGDLLKRKGLSQEAGEAYEAAAAVGREAIRLKPDSPEAHSSLARSLMRQDKLDEAIAELRTVKRLEPNYRFNWPGSVQVDLLQVQAGLNEAEYHLDLAIAYVEHNRAHELEASNPREAEPLFRQALESYRKIQGPDGPMTLELTNDLAKVLERTGHSAEAGSLFRDSLERAAQPIRARAIPACSASSTNGPTLWKSRSRAKPSRCSARRSRATARLEGPDGALTLDLTNDLAGLLDRTGRSALAEPLFRDALERARKRFGPADPRTAGIMAHLGPEPHPARQMGRGRAHPARVPGHSREEPARRMDHLQHPQPARRQPAGPEEVRRGRAADPLGLRGHEGPRGQDPPGRQAAPGRGRRAGGQASPRAKRREWQALWADVQALLKREHGAPREARGYGEPGAGEGSRTGPKPHFSSREHAAGRPAPGWKRSARRHVDPGNSPGPGLSQVGTGTGT